METVNADFSVNAVKSKSKKSLKNNKVAKAKKAEAAESERVRKAQALDKLSVDELLELEEKYDGAMGSMKLSDKLETVGDLENGNHKSDEAVAKLKLKARQKKKQDFLREKDMNRESRKEKQREGRQFEELSGTAFDEAKKRLQRGGHAPRSSSGIHPNKARKLRKQAAKNAAKLEKQYKEQMAEFKKNGGKPKAEEGEDDYVDREFAQLFREVFKPFHGIESLSQFVGPTVTFLYQMYRSRNFGDFAAAAYQYANACGVTQKYVNHLSDQLMYASAIIEEFLVSGAPLAESTSDTIFRIKNFISKIARSDFVVALRNLILGIISFKILPKDIALKIYGVFGNPPKMDLLSMMEMIVDQALTLLRYGEMLIAGQSLSDILNAKDPLSHIVGKLRDLTYFGDKLYTGLPVEGKMCLRQFIKEARELVETSETLLKQVNPTKYGFVEASKLTLLLKEQLISARYQMNMKTRPTPCAVMLLGDPSIGKGRILPFIAEIWSLVKGREFSDGHIYHRSMTSQYWEGYDPESQPIIHYSELGNASDKIVMSRGDPAFLELTSLVDSLPMAVDMAFEGKGKVFATPELVLTDTNSHPYETAKIQVKNPAAYMQRFMIIEPVVKPQFRMEGSCGIDKHKSMNYDDKIMDRWYFKVVLHQAIDTKKYNVVTLMGGTPHDDIYKLCQVLKEHFSKYIVTQEAVNERMSDVTKVNGYMNRPQDAPAAEGGDAELSLLGLMNYCGRHEFASRLWPKYLYLRRLSAAIILSFYLWFVNLLVNPSPEAVAIRVALHMIMCFVSVLLALRYRALTLLPLIVIPMSYIMTSRHFTPLVAYLNPKGLSDRRKHVSNYIGYLLGLKDMNFFESHWWSANKVKVGVALAGLTAVVASIRLYYGSKKEVNRTVQSEACTIFRTPSCLNERIVGREEEMECAQSYERLPIRNHALWNAKQILTTKCSFTNGPVELDAAILPNVRLIRMETDRPIKSFALGLKGDIAIINTHILGSGKNPTCRVSTTGSIRSENTVFIDTVLEPSRVIHLGNDLSLIKLSGIRFRDITPHLSDLEYDFGLFEASLRGAKITAEFATDSLEVNSREGPITISPYMAYSFPDHYPGACGLPLVVQKNGGSCIAAIHAAGLHDLGFGSCLIKKVVIEGINTLNDRFPLMPVVSQSGDTTILDLLDPHPKSPFLHEPLHGINYYGRRDGAIMLNQKSKIVPSRITKEVKQLFDVNLNHTQTTHFGPPVMKPIYKDGEYISPYNIALRNMAGQRAALSISILEKSIDRYVKHIVDKLGDLPKLSPLTMECAINGAPKDAFISRINAKTAGGDGFPGPKSKYLEIVLDDGISLVREPIESLKEKIIHILDKYTREESNDFVFSACLKDEPRDVEKIISGKTRVFYSSPIDNLIVARMTLASFYSLMVQHGHAFCSSVGINMHADAGQLVEELTSFSPLLIEGDYGKFDQKMAFDFGLGAATVVTRVLKHYGYNEAALKVTRGVLSDALFPFVCMNKDVMQIPGLQPSGKYATAEDNSLRGVLMLMYAWYADPVLTDFDFFEHVLPRVYGDDVLASVKEGFQDRFNNFTYQRFCNDIYFMEFTPAIKSNTFTKFVDINSASFLKRRFQYREDIAMWVAPLHKDSIMKSLMWVMPSDNVSPAEQMLSTMQSALWELAFHLTRDKHFEIRDELYRMYVSKYIDVGLDKFPTFDRIIGEIKKEY